MAGLPMSDELQISVFSVSGRIDVYVSGQVDVQPRRSTENTTEKRLKARMENRMMTRGKRASSSNV
jgi:hypothetical protein